MSLFSCFFKSGLEEENTVELTFISFLLACSAGFFYSPFPFYLLHFLLWAGRFWSGFTWASLVDPFTFFSPEKFGFHPVVMCNPFLSVNPGGPAHHGRNLNDSE